jgi:hypothetical protein
MRFWIEGMQVLTAGGLARQRSQSEVGVQAVQNSDDLILFFRAGQELCDLLRSALESFLLQNGAPVQARHIHQGSGELSAATKTALSAIVARQELLNLQHVLPISSALLQLYSQALYRYVQKFLEDFL